MYVKISIYDNLHDQILIFRIMQVTLAVSGFVLLLGIGNSPLGDRNWYLGPRRSLPGARSPQGGLNSTPESGLQLFPKTGGLGGGLKTSAQKFYSFDLDSKNLVWKLGLEWTSREFQYLYFWWCNPK